MKWFNTDFLPKPVRWLLLFVTTALFIFCLEIAGIPAALLLGSMISAILLAVSSINIKISSDFFTLAKGIIGCMVAHAITNDILTEMAADWPIFLGGVISVIIAATAIGYILARRQILPGTTAIWGSAAGGASAMVMMAEAYGADERLVAVMQYTRVVLVAVTGAALAHFLAPSHVPAMMTSLSLTADYSWLPVTLLIAFGGSLGAKYLRFPAGGMLVPFAIGVVLQNTGTVTLFLPSWLLAACYMIIGWSIGLRFTRPILAHAFSVMPVLLLSTLSLMGICGLFAVALSSFTNVDLLTAYLATSPGGADSVSIIAASTAVNVPFVMAYQTMRFIIVATSGPMIVRFVVKRIRLKTPCLDSSEQTDQIRQTAKKKML